MELRLIQKEYKTLDVMKFVMAIVVVAIHTRPEMSFNSVFVRQSFETIYSLAVPFFFMASGFLLFRKVTFPLNADGYKRIREYLVRISKLYLLWTLIYFPMTIYGFWVDGVSPVEAVAVFSRNVLLVGENFMSWPLWYLLALIVAVGIIYGLFRMKVSKIGVLIIGLFMALIGVGLNYCHEHSLMSYLTDLYFSVFLKTRNGFFEGFLFVSIGMLCATLEKIPTQVVLLLFLIGYIAEFLALPLANAFIVFAMFVVTISLQISSISESYSFRLMSSVIYFCHMFFVAVLKLCCGIGSGCLLWGTVTFASLLTCFIFTKIKKSRFIKLLFA